MKTPRRALLALTIALSACSDGDPGPAGAPGAAGAPGSPGEEGDAGVDGPRGPDAEVVPRPALVSFVPGALYLGHRATVTVSGDDTAWMDGAVEVDLGDGVSVDGLVVASPTALVADVSVDLAAELGRSDVTVTSGGEALVLAGGAAVLPSLVVQATAGALATGSAFVLDVVAPDVTSPLDPATIDVEIPGAEGVAAFVEDATPYAARIRVTADVFAPAADLDVVVRSEGGDGEVIASRAPVAIALVERAPTALDLDVPPTDVPAPGGEGSHLYAFTPPSPPAEVKLDLVVTGGDGGGAPTMIVIPPSGVLADFVAAGATATFVPQGDEPYFVLVIDESGVDDYVYDLAATVTEAPPEEVEPNDACGVSTDLVATYPSVRIASLEDATDEDWYELTLDAAQGASRLRVRSTPGQVDTDVELTVFGGDCATVVAGPRDIDLHENLLVEPLGAGTFHVRVRPSQVFPFGGSLYRLAFTLEP